MKEEQKLLRRRRKALNANNDEELADVCTSLASFYMEEGRHELACEEYCMVAAIYKKQNKQLELGTANRGIAETFIKLSKFGKALEHLQIYLSIAKECGNKLEQQRAFASIGHCYLTQHLTLPDENTKKNLHLATKFFTKSLGIVQSLDEEVDKFEIADMKARLILNIGLVEESLGKFDKAIECINKSIAICKSFDIYEHLHRSYIAFGSLLDKRGDSEQALKQFKLATEAAEKITSCPSLLASSLTSTAEVLIRLGQFEDAKNSFLQAYELRIPNKKENKAIEDNLRIAEAMRRTHEKLLSTNESEFAQLKILYEKLGDGACKFKCYKMALDYYKRMLECGLKADLSDSELATCYYSIAETYKDDNNIPESISYYQKELELCRNLKDKLNTLSKMADAKETAELPQEEISAVYRQAIDLCKSENNIHEQGRMQKRFVVFLRRMGAHSDAYKEELILAELNFVSSDTDAESSEASESVIGDDVNLEDLLETNKSNRAKRNKSFRVCKNLKGETQLHTACIKGNLKVALHLLEQGHPVNVRDNCGWLPLHEACSWGHFDIVKVLVERGAQINDRGGTECDGITPLHDAARNGFLEIVELLLEKGANPTVRTDRDETVLDYLQKWRSENFPSDCTQSELYDRLEGEIKLALDRAGHVSNTVKNNDVSVSSIVKDNRRCSRVGLEDEENEEETLNRSAEDYKLVMEGLRRKNREQNVNLPAIKSKRSALVASDEVEDNWLDDDLGQNAKKQRVSSPLKSVTLRKSSFHAIDNEMVEIPADAQDLNTPSTSYSCSLPPKRRKSQVSLITSGFSRRISSPEPLPNRRNSSQSLSMPRKRKQQVKLTSFGQTRSVAEADSSSSPNRVSAISRSFDLGPLTSGQVIEKIVGVDVRIEDKLFRVPVQPAHVNTLTIKWLGEEAARRYARKVYMLPLLELQTKSGAILSDDDPLSLLFSGEESKAEEVEARIVKWNVPPISERYKEASLSTNTEENERIVTALQELSISLNLANEGLKGVHLSPLCKALNRQTNLLELNLSGNFLTAESVRFLSASLGSLANLYKLHLNCVGLISENLQILNGSLSENSLTKLVDLDLGDNLLSDDCFESLVALLNRFKLKRLNLAMNKFTRNIFNVSNNKYLSLNIMDVEVLNVSDNEFDNEALCTMFSWLNPINVKQLDFSRNSIGFGFVSEIMKLWPSGAGGLEVLKASHCNVGDSDFFDLVINSDRLKAVDLGYNEHLTSISLKRLLQKSSVEEINLIGCRNLFENFVDFGKYISVEEVVRKTLKVGVNSREEREKCELLIEMWKDWFRDKTIIEVSAHLLHLSVK